ncbi:MAG: phage minor head protein [Devosia sp.]
MAEGSDHAGDRSQLIGMARRRAFETYMRFGRMPVALPPAAEGKAIDPLTALPTAVPLRATGCYVWHTTGDDRVRSAHAARDDRVFRWTHQPIGGHPGTEPNCRCWATPYYGDPSIPDALQPLRHSHQIDPRSLTSIESLTRPDGSIAQSVILMQDGTQIQSAFSGTQVRRVVTLRAGNVVRIDTGASTQTVYLGYRTPQLFQSAWTPSGPRLIRVRQHVAFLGDLDTLVEPEIGFDPLGSVREPFESPIRPNPLVDPLADQFLLTGAGAADLVALAMIALYLALQAAPASQGLSTGDKPVLVGRAWTKTGQANGTVIRIDALGEEQLSQSCKYLPAVQQWTDAAAEFLAPHRLAMNAQTWGTKVHHMVKQTVESLRVASPIAHAILRAELSMTQQSNDVSYGEEESTRLDIFENRLNDLGAICVYDIKTGRSGLTAARIREIAALVQLHFNGATFYIIEVRPTK